MSCFDKGVQSRATIKAHVEICSNDSEITHSQVILLKILWQFRPKYLHPPKEQAPTDTTLLLLLLISMFHELRADYNYQC